jgi:peptidoglycan hydrolase-like protein with peptidoglycan-binding domain
MKKAFLALAAASALITAAPALAAGNDSSAQHDLYAAVQTKLKTDHLYNGPINGRWTDQTSEALAVFQSRHNLAQTGRLDGPTKQALGV